jgi:hypothetical protein
MKTYMLMSLIGLIVAVSYYPVRIPSRARAKAPSRLPSISTRA